MQIFKYDGAPIHPTAGLRARSCTRGVKNKISIARTANAYWTFLPTTAVLHAAQCRCAAICADDLRLCACAPSHAPCLRHKGNYMRVRLSICAGCSSVCNCTQRSCARTYIHTFHVCLRRWTFRLACVCICACARREQRNKKVEA